MTASRSATGRQPPPPPGSPRIARGDTKPGFTLLTCYHRLPFLNNPDIALGIAVKTFLDDVPADMPAEERAARKKSFPENFVPYATHFAEDLDVAYAFFGALAEGVKALSDAEMVAADRAAWETAAKYLDVRR